LTADRIAYDVRHSFRPLSGIAELKSAFGIRQLFRRYWLNSIPHSNSVCEEVNRKSPPSHSALQPNENGKFLVVDEIVQGVLTTFY